MNLKLDGVQATLNKIQGVNNAITREIDRELRASANTIVKDAKRMAPANFGEIRNSIDFEKKAFLRYEIFADAYHAPYLEFGTRAKVKIPSEMSVVAQAVKSRPKKGTWAEFVDNIQDWIKRKGIAATQIRQNKSGKNKGKFRKAGVLAQAIYERQLAFLIARKIYKNGINPQPFLYPAWLKNKPVLIQRIQNILDKVK